MSECFTEMWYWQIVWETLHSGTLTANNGSFDSVRQHLLYPWWDMPGFLNVPLSLIEVIAVVELKLNSNISFYALDQTINKVAISIQNCNE